MASTDLYNPLDVGFPPQKRTIWGAPPQKPRGVLPLRPNRGVQSGLKRAEAKI